MNKVLEALNILARNVESLEIDTFYECKGAYQTLEKTLKALEIIKEHIKFEDSGTETYTDYLKNLVTKFMIRLESKDTGATFHIHLDTKEEFDILKAVLE